LKLADTTHRVTVFRRQPAAVGVQGRGVVAPSKVRLLDVRSYGVIVSYIGFDPVHSYVVVDVVCIAAAYWITNYFHSYVSVGWFAQTAPSKCVVGSRSSQGDRIGCAVIGAVNEQSDTKRVAVSTVTQA